MEHEARAHVVEVAFQPCEGAFADGGDAVLVVFPLADLQGAALAVEVVVVEPGEFAAAQARAVEEF